MINVLCGRQSVGEMDTKNIGTINSFSIGKQRGVTGTKDIASIKVAQFFWLSGYTIDI